MVRKAIIVGAGPVGCLAALALTKAGWEASVFEARPDPRLPENKAQLVQRSINLAMSSRGIAALQSVDENISTKFLAAAIPMRGRMIHPTSGKPQSQLYDVNGQFINSIDRARLNEDLLDELAARSIPVFFGHKLLHANFQLKSLTFRDHHDLDTEHHFDLCVGADGSYSAVRRQLMRVTRMNYQQEYIPHEYLELRIPPKVDTNGKTQFQLEPGHLHIWPRRSFMLIALPNQDKSFTSTLFAPTADFGKLSSQEDFLHWFRLHFPDAADMIGEERLALDFSRNPRSPLIHIEANPYHYRDSVVIIGDAAHAMVPFYGQGLNCGLEDVRILDILLRKHQVDPKSHAGPGTMDSSLFNALIEYSETRHEDLKAICDLAMANYEEMRHSVVKPTYRLRKWFDERLSRWTTYVPLSAMTATLNSTTFRQAPKGWLALYTMVTFRPDISYSDVRRKADHQNRILSLAGWSLLTTSTVVTISTFVNWYRRS